MVLLGHRSRGLLLLPLPVFIDKEPCRLGPKGFRLIGPLIAWEDLTTWCSVFFPSPTLSFHRRLRLSDRSLSTSCVCTNVCTCVRLWLTCMCMIIRYALRSFIWNFLRCSFSCFWISIYLSIYHLSRLIQRYASWKTPSTRCRWIVFRPRETPPILALYCTVHIQWHQWVALWYFFFNISLPFLDLIFLRFSALSFPFHFCPLLVCPFQVPFFTLVRMYAVEQQARLLSLNFLSLQILSFHLSFIPVLISVLISTDPNMSLIWSELIRFDPIRSYPTGSKKSDLE